jgi:SAM-dependent methyltransferase
MPTGKADFTEIYVQPDPRAYHRALGELDYEIPEQARAIFATLLEELRGSHAEPSVLDVCCSYGINAALLNHEVSLEEVREHYAGGEGLSRRELIERDREWFAARRRADAVEVIGLDASEAAVSYAVEGGLLAEGMVADLESDALPESVRSRLDDVELVTVTGGIGYIGPQTFERLLDALEQPPWVAALSLRWVDFDPVAEALDSYGLTTEKLDDFVVPQRRFVDADERDFALEQLSARGLEATAVEENDRHGAELYIARPQEDVADTPIEELLASIS